MPNAPLFPRPAPASRQQWLLVLAVGLVSFLLLRYHLWYLNHLDAKDWGYRYLMVNPENPAFHRALRRLKLVICTLWIAALGFAWYYSLLRLKAKGRRPDRQAFRRLALALALFLFTVVNYNPPDIDLSTYFFFNSLGYAGLAWALYRLPHSHLTLELAGKLVMCARQIPTLALCAGAALFVTVTAHALGGIFFAHLPLTVDTAAQIAHAKMLLTGRWYLPSHPLREFFDMYMMINNGRWYSQYPPGHVLVLAAGIYFKQRSYVNPVLGGLTVLAIYGLALELYGRRVARIAVVLAAGCVYMIVMSSEFMSNATALLTGTLFLWAYFRMLKRPDWNTGLWGGAALGFCFITRPYTALTLALPYIIHSMYLLLARARDYWKPLALMGAVGSCFVLFQLYYNHATNGHPFTFGYELSWGTWHNPLKAQAAEKLTDSELVKNFRENMQRTGWFNRLTFEWPVPSLSLLVLAYAWRGSRIQEKLLMLTLFSFLASCQVLPGNVEREWGPRLMYEVLSTLVVLSARALSLMPAFFRILCRERRSLAYYYGYAAAMAVTFGVFAAGHNLNLSTLRNIYNFYNRGNNPGYYRQVARSVETPALVFMRGDLYQTVSFNNPPTPSQPIIYAHDLGTRNIELMEFYPERKAYLASFVNGVLQVNRLRDER